VLKQTDKAMTSIRSSIEQAEGALRSALNSSGTNARMTSTFQFRNAQGVADASQAFFAATTDTSTNRLQSGDSFTINLATYDAAGNVVSTLGTVTVTNGASTVQQVIDAINSTGGASPLNTNGQAQRVFAYLNDSGNLVIENAVAGRDPAASANTFGIRFSSVNVNGPSQNGLEAFSFTGATGSSAASSTTGTANQTINMVGGQTDQATRAGAAATFREVMTQIGNTARDASFNGTNLLAGDFLRVAFNEDNTSSITTQGRRVDATSLGFQVDSAAAQTGDAVRNFQSDREINNALTKLRNAKSTVSSLQSQFGSNSSLIQNRAEYTRETILNLNDGADSITLADINEEGANLTSLQTRQQLSITALSLANQADQAILRLF
jgi:flagellin-like hook-associated protein FlgL